MDLSPLAIEKFNTDPDCCVFLISLKAGGLALNLTVAQNCFLMDPWWNPAAEFQAIDRIYRLGQYKSIHVVRIILSNTIEERVLLLQEKKHLLFDSTVGMDQDALSRLSVDDLKFLFS
jgi:DNA repair protein RAD16